MSFLQNAPSTRATTTSKAREHSEQRRLSPPSSSSYFLDAQTNPLMSTESPPSLTVIENLTASDDNNRAPLYSLPQDAVHNIIGRLSLRQALSCSVSCRFFRDAISSPPFPFRLPPLPLLALRHPRFPSVIPPSLFVLDPTDLRWLRIPLSFLPPFVSPPSPASASPSLLLLWADVSHPVSHSVSRSLVICNPLTKSFRVLPPLGSAWSRHGTVIASPDGGAIVLTELAALLYSQECHSWLKFSLNLPSKPRSPILVSGEIFALCDVGSPWRSQWKMFSCPVKELGRLPRRPWAPLDRPEWGDVFDILKRPRLVPGGGSSRILMIGGLRSSFAVDSPCSTVLILRLDLKSMEWDEASRMPEDMYRCFIGNCNGNGNNNINGNAPGMGQGINNKVKVFGGGGRVWFSGKKVKGKLAMWEEGDRVAYGGGSQGCLGTMKGSTGVLYMKLDSWPYLDLRSCSLGMGQ